MVKKIFKFVIACLIYLQIIQLVILIVIRLPLLIVNPLGYLLIISANTLYLWVFSIIYRFKLSDQKDLNNLFWKLPFNISQYVGLKPKLEYKYYLYYFIFTLLLNAEPLRFIKQNPAIETFFNISGLISLIIFFSKRSNDKKSKKSI